MVEISDEDDVLFVKAQFTVQRRKTTELEARQAVLERNFKDLEAENDRMRQELKQKSHNQEQLELMLNYRESERDELKQTVERLQGIYTRVCTKLKDIEDENRTLKVSNHVREQVESGQDTIEWADKIKQTLGVSDQALHFYNALKFNHKLLKETEQRLAETNTLVEQLKAQNSKYKRLELQKVSENRPLEEFASLKRPRPDDSFLMQGGGSLERLVPPKKRPLSLIK